mmetsp:Transcript_2249/g.4279  ORF Transcript_2249/g.4279 Transcript_2249/m.4279 type:complete len:2528 (+) Transcript_2249:99-7682(+)
MMHRRKHVFVSASVRLPLDIPTQPSRCADENAPTATGLCLGKTVVMDGQQVKKGARLVQIGQTRVTDAGFEHIGKLLDNATGKTVTLRFQQPASKRRGKIPTEALEDAIGETKCENIDLLWGQVDQILDDFNQSERSKANQLNMSPLPLSIRRETVQPPNLLIKRVSSNECSDASEVDEGETQEQLETSKRHIVRVLGQVASVLKQSTNNEQKAKEQLTALSSELAATSQLKSELEAKVTAIENSLDRNTKSFQKELAERDRQIHELEGMEHVQVDFGLQGIDSDLQAKVNEISRGRMFYKRESDFLRKTVASMSEKNEKAIQALKDENTRLSAAKTFFEKQVGMMRNSLERVTNDTQIQTEQSALKRHETDQVVNLVTTLENRYEDTIKDMKKELESKSIVIEDLRKEVENLNAARNAECFSYEEQLKQCYEKDQTLTNKLSELEARNTAQGVEELEIIRENNAMKAHLSETRKSLSDGLRVQEELQSRILILEGERDDLVALVKRNDHKQFVESAKLEELSVLESQVEAVKEENEIWKADVLHLRESVQQLSESLAVADTQKAQLKAQLLTQTSMVETLESQLHKEKTESENLHNEIDHLQAKEKDLSKSLASREQQEYVFRAQLEELRVMQTVQMQDLKRDMEREKKRDFDEVESQKTEQLIKLAIDQLKSEHESTIDHLQETFAHQLSNMMVEATTVAEQKFHATLAKIETDYEGELAKVRLAVEHSQVALQDSENDRVGLERALGRLSDDLTTQDQTLEERVLEIEELRLQNDQLSSDRKELETCKSELFALQQILQQENDNFSKLESNSQLMMKELEKVTTKLKQMKSESEQQFGELKLATAERDQLRETIDTCEQKYQEAQTGLTQALDKLVKLEESKEAMVLEAGNLQKKLDDETDKCIRLEGENDELSSRCTSLHRENISLGDELLTLKHASQQNEVGISDLEKHIIEKVAKIDDLKRELREAEKLLTASRDQLRHSEDKVSNLEQNIVSLKEQNSMLTKRENKANQVLEMRDLQQERDSRLIEELRERSLSLEESLKLKGDELCHFMKQTAESKAVAEEEITQLRVRCEDLNKQIELRDHDVLKHLQEIESLKNTQDRVVSGEINKLHHDVSEYARQLQSSEKEYSALLEKFKVSKNEQEGSEIQEIKCLTNMICKLNGEIHRLELSTNSSRETKQQVLQALEERIIEHSEQKLALEKQLEGLTVDFEKKNKLVQDQEEEIRQLLEGKGVLQADLSKTILKLGCSQEDYSGLLQKLNFAQNEHKKSEQVSQSRIQELATNRDCLELELRTLESEKASLNEKLESALEMSKSQYAQVEQDRDNLFEKVNHLEQINQEQVVVQQQLHSRIVELEGGHTCLLEENRNVRLELESEKARIAEFKISIREGIERESSSNARVAELESKQVSDNSEFKEQINFLELEKGIQKDENNRLVQEMKGLKSQIASMELSSKQSESRLTQCTLKIESLECESKNALDKLNSSEVQVGVLKRMLSDLEGDNLKLRSNFEAKADEARLLERSLQEISEEHAKVSSKFRHAESELVQSNELQAEAKSRVKSLENENHTQLRKHDQLLKQIAIQSQEISKLKEVVHLRESRLSQFEEEANAAKSDTFTLIEQQAEEMKNEKMKLNEENCSLRNETKLLEIELSSLQDSLKAKENSLKESVQKKLDLELKMDENCKHLNNCIQSLELEMKKQADEFSDQLQALTKENHATLDAERRHHMKEMRGTVEDAQKVNKLQCDHLTKLHNDEIECIRAAHDNQVKALEEQIRMIKRERERKEAEHAIQEQSTKGSFEEIIAKLNEKNEKIVADYRKRIEGLQLELDKQDATRREEPQRDERCAHKFERLYEEQRRIAEETAQNHVEEIEQIKASHEVRVETIKAEHSRLEKSLMGEIDQLSKSKHELIQRSTASLKLMEDSYKEDMSQLEMSWEQTQAELSEKHESKVAQVIEAYEALMCDLQRENAGLVKQEDILKESLRAHQEATALKEGSDTGELSVIKQRLETTIAQRDEARTKSSDLLKKVESIEAQLFAAEKQVTLVEIKAGKDTANFACEMEENKRRLGVKCQHWKLQFVKLHRENSQLKVEFEAFSKCVDKRMQELVLELKSKVIDKLRKQEASIASKEREVVHLMGAMAKENERLKMAEEEILGCAIRRKDEISKHGVEYSELCESMGAQTSALRAHLASRDEKIRKLEVQSQMLKATQNGAVSDVHVESLKKEIKSRELEFKELEEKYNKLSCAQNASETFLKNQLRETLRSLALKDETLSQFHERFDMSENDKAAVEAESSKSVRDEYDKLLLLQTDKVEHELETTKVALLASNAQYDSLQIESRIHRSEQEFLKSALAKSNARVRELETELKEVALSDDKKLVWVKREAALYSEVKMWRDAAERDAERHAQALQEVARERARAEELRELIESTHPNEFESVDLNYLVRDMNDTLLRLDKTSSQELDIRADYPEDEYESSSDGGRSVGLSRMAGFLHFCFTLQNLEENVEQRRLKRAFEKLKKCKQN